VGDIGSSLADITVHLAHDTDVLVTVQQRVLLILATTTGGRPVGFQTGVGEDDDQTLGVLVVCWNGDMLLRNELRQLGRGARLGPWRYSRLAVCKSCGPRYAMTRNGGK
jgi:hypothetical protein